MGSKCAYVKVEMSMSYSSGNKIGKKQKGSWICATELSVFLANNTSQMFSKKVSLLFNKFL